MTLATEHAWLQRASCGAGCVHAGADAPGARWVVVCRIALRTDFTNFTEDEAVAE